MAENSSPISEQEEFEFRARRERELGIAPPTMYQEPPKRRTPMEMMVRDAGLVARTAIEAPLSVPAAILDAPRRVRQAFGMTEQGSDLPPEARRGFGESLHRTLSAIGFPEPETLEERIVTAIGGGGLGAGGLSRVSQVGIPLREALSGATAGGAAQTAGELGAPPPVQEAIGLATLARPNLRLKPPATSIRAPENAVRLQTFQEANAAGYKFPPSRIERGITREAIESIGGKAALNQEASLHNQQITNRLAKEGASLRPEQDLTEANLALARDELAEPYRQVASLSPAAANALDTWKDANANAKLHWNDYQRNQTVSAYKQYQKYDARAEAAQSTMEAEAIRTGNPQLVQNLREARVKIAQNWDVDKALNIGTGDVRSDVLGRMLNKRGEKGMSGPLGTIAKTQQAFPQFMKETAKTPTPGVSKLEGYTSLGLGALGLKHGGLSMEGAGLGLAGLALPFASRGARALALSSPMQRPLQQQGIPLSAVTNYLATRHDYDR